VSLAPGRETVREDPIDPRLPIIDPHHHLWDNHLGRYLDAELLADTGTGHNIVATVFVECGTGYLTDGPEAFRPIGETRFADDIAHAAPNGAVRLCAGIVSTADLAVGTAVREVLEAHLSASPKRFRGIRYRAAWDESPAILATYPHTAPARILRDPAFRRGFAELEKLGLSFDAWIYHPQIPELTDLARAFPRTSIILDHFGGPLGIGAYQGRADEVFADWRKAMDELATCPNVTVKIGGINMPVNGFGWHERAQSPGSAELAAATGRYYLHAIEKFGPSRCMFESNFPVDKLSCSYEVLWNSFKRMTRDFSADEKAQLFHDTARRVYRL
jgi:L-fuconolactonase